MEKFGLLNLIKALDGLNSGAADANPPTPPAEKHGAENAAAQKIELPNIMYQTILRHEQMSNRLHNKK